MAMVSVEDFEEIICLISDMYTAIIFCMGVGVGIFLIFSYVVVRFFRNSWVSFLERRFPDLEFVRGENLRSSVDTQRNVGVIVTLLTMRGPCDVSHITRKLAEDVVDKRLEDGHLAFRHLRMILTTRWGKYAWMNGPFRLENHVSVGWSVYKGRPVCELNIQECVCELVSKYLATDVSPWHLTIIPTSSERYYLLLRVHHLLLSKTTGLRISDFLPVTAPESREVVHRHLSSVSLGDTTSRPQPFVDLYKSPLALPALVDQLSESFSNRWNEFLAIYDPHMNPKVLKRPTVTIFLALSFISVVEWLKKFLSPAVARPHRNFVSLHLLIISLWNSFGPITVIRRLICAPCRVFKFFFISLPVLFLCECWALWRINDEQYSDRSFIKMVFDGWAGIQATLREITYFGRLCFSGPRVIAEAVFGGRRGTPNYLQTASRGGRKVVSWSLGVPIEHIIAIREATGASCSEVVLTALSASLRDFFLMQGRPLPYLLYSTAQAVSHREIFSKRYIPARSHGIVCLPIPTRNPWDDEEGPIAELHSMQQMLLRTQLEQPFLYLMSSLEMEHSVFSKALPAQFVRFIMNALSRRFPVSLTDIMPPFGGEYRKQQLWGQDVERFMYWNPPQANVCLSISVMSDGDTVSVGVMSDSLLAPHHSIVSSTFPGHIRRLATAASALIEPRYHPVPINESDESGGSRTSHSLSSSSDDIDFEDEDEFNSHFMSTTAEYRQRFS